MLGSSNIDAGPAMAFMTGNLSYQIEHHLYRICRATGWPRSRCGCARCATNTTCLTPRVRCWCSTARCGAQCQAVVAEQVPVRHGRRRTGNPQREDVRRARAGIRRDRPGNRRGLKTAMATVRQWRRRNGLRRKGFAHSRWASRWTWPYRQIRRNSLGRRRQGGSGWPGRNCAGLVVSERLQDVRSA